MAILSIASSYDDEAMGETMGQGSDNSEGIEALQIGLLQILLFIFFLQATTLHDKQQFHADNTRRPMLKHAPWMFRRLASSPFASLFCCGIKWPQAAPSAALETDMKVICFVGHDLVVAVGDSINSPYPVPGCRLLLQLVGVAGEGGRVAPCVSLAAAAADGGGARATTTAAAGITVGGGSTWVARCMRLSTQLAGVLSDAIRGGGSCNSVSSKPRVIPRQGKSPWSPWWGPSSTTWGPLSLRAGHAMSLRVSGPWSSSISTLWGPPHILATKLHCPSIINASGSVLPLSLFSVSTLQPVILPFRAPARQLLLWRWFDNSASTWVYGSSFFYLWQRHEHHHWIAGIFLLRWLHRPTLHRRIARSIHPGARVIDAPANTPRRQNRFPPRLSRFCCLFF